MTRKILILILFVALISMQAIAQTELTTPIIRNNAIGLVPQYTIVGGFRMDYERRISPKSNQWIIASPQVYMVTNGRLGHDFVDLNGFGIDMKHRIFLAESTLEPKGFYFEYGPMFQQYKIKDERTYTEKYFEDGIEYYTIKTGVLTTKLMKLGGNFHLGYQWLLGQKAFLDLFAGPGIRISFDDRNEGFSPWYNDMWIDYGYSGTLLDGGLRVGFYF